MTTRLLIGILLLVAIAAGALALVWNAPQTVVTAAPIIDSVTVERPNIVVIGHNLSRVEVWAIPTGTNLTPADYQNLGAATLASTTVDGEQRWSFPIPTEPVLATQIFVRGYDGNGSSTDAYLPQTGATALSEALWGTGDSASSTTGQGATSTSLTLGVGQTGRFKGLSVTFNRLVQDSRCPVDAECIEAGAVTANVTFTTAGHTETKNMPSDEVPQQFDKYRISIASVIPPRQSGQEIAPSDYRIAFHIEDTAGH